MIPLGDVQVEITAAHLCLYLLYTRPRRWIPIAEILNVSRTAAIMRIQRAAESLPDPKLAATLREQVHWRGDTAMYTPGIKM